MIKKYCDMCGEEISKEELNKDEEELFPDGYYSVSPRVPVKIDGNTTKYLGYGALDMCAECTKAMDIAIRKYVCENKATAGDPLEPEPIIKTLDAG